MTAKPPTPQGISALLRKAGFTRREFTGGGRVGHRNHTAGFVVRGREAGVLVMHGFGSFDVHDAEQRRTWLRQYAGAIESAGWAVAESAGRLIVTAAGE